jgi:hypothetical protein
MPDDDASEPQTDFTIRRSTKLELGLVVALVLNGIGIGIFVGQVRGLTSSLQDVSTEMRSFREQAPKIAVMQYRIEQLEQSNRAEQARRK